MKVVVIPAYNEEKKIGEVVREAKKFVDLVIVVDDGSGDKTAEIASKEGAKVYKLSRNMGKGYAMRFGAKKALEKGADIVIFMDGDGQHRAEDLPRFIEALERADAAFGQRKADGMPLLRRFGNWGIKLIFRLLFGREPGDMLCGFKAFRREALEKVWWESNDYFVESEITAKACLRGIKVERIEIPSIYGKRRKGMGIIDGLKVGIKLFLLRVKTLRS